MAPSLVVIVNPTSGRGRSGKILPRVREALAASGVDHDVRLSRSPLDPPRMAEEAAREGARIVAAMGGDGMVGMVGSSLVGTGAALGVIPVGTGNDFARMIGLNRKKPVEAVKLLAGDPRIVPIDAVRVSGTSTGAEGSLGSGGSGGSEGSDAGSDVAAHFINVAGAGFDSDVTETANRMKSRVQGTAKYVAAVIKTLRVFTPAQFEVTVDGESRSLSGMLIAVGNGRSYGGGMNVCPDASLTDGALEVCVVGGMSKGAFLRAFPRVFRGTHVDHPKVTMMRGARVELAADRPFNVYADGERSVPLPAVFEVLPKALEVAVPQGVNL